LRVGPHRVVDVAVVLHVIRIRTAVSPDVARDPAGRTDVVVAADRADVLPPGTDANERGLLPIGQNLLGLVDVDDDLGPHRDLHTERGDRLWLVEDGFERISGLDPLVVAGSEESEIVDARVAK